MQEWRLRRSLGEEGLCITVNPCEIRFETRIFPSRRRRQQLRDSGIVPRPLLPVLERVIYEMREFRIAEEDILRAPLEQTPIYMRMKDVSDHRNDLTRSRTYAQVLGSLRDYGVFRHKNYVIEREDQIVQCIYDCYLEIILSMEQHGYISGKESEFATAGMGSVIIDRDGSVLKALAASHRLAAARIAGVQGGFPLRVIGAHAEWLDRHGIEGAGFAPRLHKALRLVNRG